VTTEGDDVTTETAGPSRVRIIAARILVVVGVVLLVVSLLANFVKREALDEDTFRQTSQELVANEEIRDQVAATMVEQLYTNVDVAARLEARLPENLQSLAGPIAGLSREAIDRAARELLERPRVQNLFVASASLSQQQVVKVLEGETRALETQGGNVVLDLRPLVVRLGDRFGFLGNVDETLPPDAGRITIMESDELETAQNLTQALKVVADWIWVFAFLAFALAIWLVPGRRRLEVRAIAVGLIVAGVAVLVLRRLAGSYLVENLVESESVKPAVSAFWDILSDGLAEGAWVGIVVGAIGAAGLWLTGGGRRAVAARRWLGPWLERTDLAWAGFAVLLIAVVWALPLYRFVTTAVLVVLGAAGFELARRQIVREYEAEGPAAPRPRLEAPWRRPAAPVAGPAEELERLARLRADELLTEEEYAAAKERVLEPAGR
jgi:hypothetical protein